LADKNASSEDSELFPTLPICQTKKTLAQAYTMPQFPKPLLLLLCLLLSLNGLAQVQAAVRMAWMDAGHSTKVEPQAHQHAPAEEHHAAMSCCDEDDSSSSQQTSPCTSSHLCCTAVAVLPSMTPAIALGMGAAPPIRSNRQPLPLAALSFWRPPRA